MPKYKVLIAEFPYGGLTHHSTSDWVTDVVLKMRDDPRIGPGGVARWSVKDTPVTMCRNRCLVAAEENHVDYVLMLDSDMVPDVRYAEQTDDDAVPFWDAAWDFAMRHEGPCVVAAPYCGPPPHENVFAFRWADFESRTPTPNYKLEQYTRFEAAQMRGVQPAAAAATGVMLLDMRAVKPLKHPRFYYEYTDEREVHKASTEDVTFTRDINWAFGRDVVHVAWDSWAGHWKWKCVGRPVFVTGEEVRRHQRAGDELARARATAADAPVPGPLTSDERLRRELAAARRAPAPVRPGEGGGE